MKQHLTGEDLLELSGMQRDRLRDLWQPRIYDLVLADICIDVENERYRQSEFIIGDLTVRQNYQGCTILLRDLRAMGTEHCPPATDDAENPDPPETAAEAPAFAEDDLQAGYQFEEYNKEDCLPLLGIGQIIELLQRLNYGDAYFYLTVPATADYLCSIGRDGYAADHEQAELCEVLWECLKERL